LENQISIFYIIEKIMDINAYQQQMEKAIAYLENEFKWMQVWRATTWLVENLNVETDYWTMKMNGIALITALDHSTIKIEPRDKSSAKHIANAIYEADLWVWVDNQGSHILVKVPQLTQERREQIAKNIKAMWEETKWNIRKVRQDAMNDTKKSFTAKEISEDEHKANESNIDELTKKMNAKIDDLVKAKTEEVLKV